VTGLLETFARQVGWSIAHNNVVVEGTSDVAFLSHASDLHAIARGRPVLDGDFAVLAAGRGDDGGVDGVNRRLSLVRQLTDVDRHEDGRLRHRFVGLLDNDAAGRGALAVACRFDRRVEPYQDLFLLQPVMPDFIPGVDRAMAVAQANLAFRQFDWEIEDLCSERLLVQLERDYPCGVLSKHERAGLVHRELSRAAKVELRRLFVESATIVDARGFLDLLRAMRRYQGLDHEFVLT